MEKSPDECLGTAPLTRPANQHCTLLRSIYVDVTLGRVNATLLLESGRSPLTIRLLDVLLLKRW